MERAEQLRYAIHATGPPRPRDKRPDQRRCRPAGAGLPEDAHSLPVSCAACADVALHCRHKRFESKPCVRLPGQRGARAVARAVSVALRWAPKRTCCRSRSERRRRPPRRYGATRRRKRLVQDDAVEAVGHQLGAVRCRSSRCLIPTVGHGLGVGHGRRTPPRQVPVFMAPVAMR